MQRVIELVANIEAERERIRTLGNEVSHAFGAAGEEDWPGEHELLDQAERTIQEAHLPLLRARDLLAQYIGTAEVEKAQATT